MGETDKNTLEKLPKLIIISGFSGVGKGTVVEELLKINREIFFSISDTDREKRNSLDKYNFITTEEFRENLKKGHYIEYTQYGSDLYGSPRSPIINELKAGHDVILEINTHGLRQVCQDIDLKRLGIEIIAIFIVCDFNALIDRLKGRGTSVEEINKRIKITEEETKFTREYDFILVNHEVKKTVEKIQNIIVNCSIDSEEFNYEEFQTDIKYYLEEAGKYIC